MAYSSFGQFAEALEKAGELIRVSQPVDTDLLIAEWANREMKSPGGGKALLFEKPVIDGRESKFPLAINTLLFSKLPYDPAKDLALVTVLTTQPSWL